jgi:hypothetical protein
MLRGALTPSQVGPLWEGQRAWKDRSAKIDPSNDAPVPFSASWPNWFGYFGVRLGEVKWTGWEKDVSKVGNVWNSSPSAILCRNKAEEYMYIYINIMILYNVGPLDVRHFIYCVCTFYKMV